VSKKLGAICVALGVFLLAVAGLAKFYAYDALAVVPLDQETTSVSFGPDATYLNIGAEGGPAIESGDLVSTRRVVGDVEASEAASDELDRDVAVWETYSFNNPADSKDNDEEPLSGRIDYVAFDRHTGEAVDCCDTYTETGGNQTPIVFEGQYFKLPFNTQKQDYLFWDGSLEQATPMVYQEEEEVEGLTTYRFEQTIEPTDIDLQSSGGENEFTEVPGSLIGMDEPSVETDRMYSNVRTLWVEPETGVIIKAQEDQLSTLDVDGEPVATITDVVIGYDEDTVKSNADEYSSLASSLKLIRSTVPLVGLVLGVILLAAGIFLLVRSHGSGSGTRRTA
jgi:hypothetical protein